MSDYDGLKEEYLNLIQFSRAMGSTWNNANEIYPDSLTILYLVQKNLYDTNFDSTVITSYDAKDVEDFIQSKFNVSIEHLRKSSHYDAKTSTYSFIGLGDPGLTKVVDANIDGNNLLLSYERYSRTDDITVASSGVVTISFNKNSYKYISCEHHVVD